MNDKWVSALWQRFKDIYGQKWTALFQGPEAIESWRITWMQGLLGFSGEQLRHGVEALAKAYPEWPPTMGQFRELCWIPPKPAKLLPFKRIENPEGLQKLRDLASKPRRAWKWTPDKIVNEIQVSHVVEAAERGYPPAVSFLDGCKRAGVITAGNKLGTPIKDAA